MLTKLKFKRSHFLYALVAVIVLVAMTGALCVSASEIEPQSVRASLRVYYTRYLRTTTWTANYYVASDGTLTYYSDTSLNLRTSDFISINPSVIKEIAVYTNESDQLFQIRHMAFYDSNQAVISGYGYQASEVGGGGPRTITTIPSNAAYFRFTVRGSRTGTQARNYYKPILLESYAPEGSIIKSFIYSQFYDVSYQDGYAFISTSNSYAIDFLRVDVIFYEGNAPHKSFDMNVEARYYNSQNQLTYFPYSNSAYADADASLMPIYYYADDIEPYDDPVYSDVNPAQFHWTSQDAVPSCGVRIHIPVYTPNGVTTTGFRLDFSNIVIDDVVASLDFSHAQDQMNGLIDDLSVPLPTVQVGDLINNAMSGVDSTTTNALFGMYWVPLTTSMLIIVVTFALLGYVLYGKKDS